MCLRIYNLLISEFNFQKIYHQYCGGKEFKHGRQQDLDAQSEFMRQRDYLERTVASLKNLYHKESTKKTSSGKIIKVN